MSHGIDPAVIRRIEAFLTVQETGTLELICKEGRVVGLRITAATLWHAPSRGQEQAMSNGRADDDPIRAPAAG